MDLKNAAEFDRVVTGVLTALADAFPKPIDLDFQELGFADGPAYATKDFHTIATEHTPKHSFAAQCVRFLVEAGYVSGVPHPTWTAHVLLTSKGLELINATPGSLLRGTH